VIKVIAICTMRADGTHVPDPQLGADPTSLRKQLQDLTPTWSPDGKRLAFNRLRLNTGHGRLHDTSRRIRSPMDHPLEA
jgi:hypothetical protein